MRSLPISCRRCLTPASTQYCIHLPALRLIRKCKRTHLNSSVSARQLPPLPGTNLGDPPNPPATTTFLFKMDAESALSQFRQSLTSIENAHKATLQLLETTRAQLAESENRDYAQLFADVLRKLNDKQAKLDKHQQELSDKQRKIDECEQQLARVKRELGDAVARRDKAREEALAGRGWTWDRRDEVWRCCACHGEECECAGRPPVWRANRRECDGWGKLESRMPVSGEGEGEDEDDGGLFVPLVGDGLGAGAGSSHTLRGDSVDDDVLMPRSMYEDFRR